ncbi:hypothetical protein [Streptomyces lydicus]|uniref:hypothetical protein n=1 Tax=Streptomyces lydicus TaxID=47763 RepID=UPI00370FE4F4
MSRLPPGGGGCAEGQLAAPAGTGSAWLRPPASLPVSLSPMRMLVARAYASRSRIFSVTAH